MAAAHAAVHTFSGAFVCLLTARPDMELSETSCPK